MFSPGVIVLAAGGSSRMGKSKQLLPWGKVSLLRHTVDVALQTQLEPVIVVLGAESKACHDEIRDLPAHVALNENWERGMGTSIAAGIRVLRRKNPQASGAVLMLVDQPLVTPERLQNLIALKESSDAPLVGSFYGGDYGVPAVFDKTLFKELEHLEGSENPRKIMTRHLARMSTISAPEAFWDIDTPQDYQKILEIKWPTRGEVRG